MAEAVVGAVVGTVTQVVIDKLRSLKINQAGDFSEDLEKLKSNFEMMNETLHDAGMQRITSRVVKLWLKKLEDVVFDAYHALDKFDYQLLHEKLTIKKRRGKRKLGSFFPGFFTNDPRRILGQEIMVINVKLDSINREAKVININQNILGVVNAPGVGSDAFASPETDSFTVDPVFIGRENDVSTIVETLTAIPIDKVLSILPIVGMGGLGKTTLARKVYHDEKIRAHFRNRIWVHVSTKFNTLILFKKILTTLTSEKVELENREAVLKKLQEALSDKTFLLVFDDVWNQDLRVWEDFITPLFTICSPKGNGIIVTTRNSEVASIVGTLPHYKLEGLSKESCWSIIKAKAFRERDIGSSEIETIGRGIANRCQGLPLAASVVGGALRGQPKDHWLSIKDYWLSDVEEHGINIKKILELSFHHLPSPSLKKCFAYCSIFPKGTRIDRKELIELWMAQGFLQPSQTSDMENIGNKFLNVLLHNSLMQVIDRDRYGNVRHCSMHDLVHDVACSVSDDMFQTQPIRWKSNGDGSSRIPEEQAKRLHTLFFQGESSGVVFSDFERLHVLNLATYKVEELPDSIRKLIHLRCLNISDTQIEYLPDWISELSHLQTLRANGVCGIRLKKLPNTLMYLINLRHLHISDYSELPPRLGMLTSLQTLPFFKVGDEEGHRIAELGNLKNLEGELSIFNLEKVPGEEESKKAYLFQKSGIVRLVIYWGWGKRRESEMNDEDVLKGLQPHSNLKILEIHGFKGEKFPSWTLKMAVCLEGHWVGLDNLMEIRLFTCVECEEIPTLGHLPHLKTLYLSHLLNVKSIGSSFYGIDNCVSYNGVCNVFPSLERLELHDMPKLTEWVEVEIPTSVEVKVFPCLKYLNIEDCFELKTAPSQFPCLRELEIIRTKSGSPLESICGIKLTSLAKLKIEGLKELVCLPDWLFHNNQNFSMLEIRNCPTLRGLPDGLRTLKFLENLSINLCPDLKSIPCSSGRQSQGLTSLRRLSICNCEGLMNLPSEMMESCAPSLEYMSLRNIRRVMNMPRVIESLHKMPSLRNLDIENVPKFIITSSPKGLGSLPNLLSLKIKCDDSESWDCVLFKEAVDGILKFGSHSLRELKLRGREDLDSLPDQTQHLIALSYLKVDGFGIEELSEWFGNLSSLKALYLYNCKKLRRLPSVEAMRRLTNLFKLDISGCPLLEERIIKQSDDDDSEWPKISNIPNIVVDWSEIRRGD